MMWCFASNSAEPGLPPINQHLSRILIASAVCLLIAACPERFAHATGPEQTGQERAAGTRRAAELTTFELASGGVSFALGDKLRLTFFERLDAQEGSQEPGASLNIVERVELTGDYTVHDDGSLFLPFVGQVQVAGLTLDGLRKHLAHEFEAVFGRKGHISIAILEREPIYIVGPVARPGTYRFSPRMSVLHALALSGGFERSTADVYHFLEAVREREKVRKATERLKLLLARQTVLKAERAGRRPEMPKRLIDLAGRESAETLVAEIANIRKLHRDTRSAQLETLESTIKSGKQELQNLRSRVAQIQSNISNRSERLQVVGSMLQKGMTGGHNIYQARSDLSDVQERLLDAMVAISHTEHRVAVADQEKIKLLADAQLELDRDSLTTDQELVDTEISLDLGRQALTGLAQHEVRVPVSGSTALYQVFRRTPGGVKMMSVDETFFLWPGDLVRIESRIETGSLN